MIFLSLLQDRQARILSPMLEALAIRSLALVSPVTASFSNGGQKLRREFGGEARTLEEDTLASPIFGNVDVGPPVGGSAAT